MPNLRASFRENFDLGKILLVENEPFLRTRLEFPSANKSEILSIFEAKGA